MSATLGTMRVAAPPAGSSIARKIEASEAQLLWQGWGWGWVEVSLERGFRARLFLPKARSKPQNQRPKPAY